MANYNCILLAAGFSRRFGGNKLLTDFHGKPLWRWSLDALLSLQKKHTDLTITVVSQYEEILEEAKRQSCNSVRNPAPEGGISSSLKLGAEAAMSHASKDGYLVFFVADQPYLTPGQIEALFHALEYSGKRLGALSTDGVPGNPVAFGVEYLPELLALEGDKGGKRVFLRHIQDAVLVEAPSHALYDIDTKESF